MVWAFIFNDKLVKTVEIFPQPKTEYLPNYRKRKKKKKSIFVTIVMMK